MTFDAEMVGVTEDIVTTFGSAATYTPAGGGDPVSTIAVVNEGVEDIPKLGWDTVAVDRVETLDLLKADVGVPARDATVRMDAGKYSGITFTVARVKNDDGYVVSVVVSD